jgi:hypothetical protein
VTFAISPAATTLTFTSATPGVTSPGTTNVPAHTPPVRRVHAPASGRRRYPF